MPRIALLATTLALSACATPGASNLQPGGEVSFEGRLTASDTAPWAYDGNARLTVDTSMYGAVVVELPARWNLCKASGIGEAGNYPVGDRVQVTGTVTADGTVSVCERASHRIARSP